MFLLAVSPLSLSSLAPSPSLDRQELLGVTLTGNNAVAKFPRLYAWELENHELLDPLIYYPRNHEQVRLSENQNVKPGF